MKSLAKEIVFGFIPISLLFGMLIYFIYVTNEMNKTLADPNVPAETKQKIKKDMDDAIWILMSS